MNRLAESVPFLFTYLAGLLTGGIVVFWMMVVGWIKYEVKHDKIISGPE